MTPPARPGSLPLALAQRHPVLRWLCLPRIGPKRRHQWLPRAVGEPNVQSCTIPYQRAQFAQPCTKETSEREAMAPLLHPCWGPEAFLHGGQPSATMSPSQHRQDGNTWHGWSGVSWALTEFSSQSPIQPLRDCVTLGKSPSSFGQASSLRDFPRPLH